MTTEDIKLVIQAFYKVNSVERKLHGEQEAYNFSRTESYWERILEQYIYMKEQVPILEKVSNENKN
jgi:hypothetical protein